MPKFARCNSYTGKQSNQNWTGSVRAANASEATAGDSTSLYISPATLASSIGTLVPAWSETVSGIGKLSTNTQALTGTNDTTAMTPLKVAAVLATPPAIGSGTPAAGTFSSLSTSGDLSLTSVATKINMNGGADTDFIGTATLVLGTVTVSNTNIAAGDRIIVTRSAKNASTAYGTFEVVKSPAVNFVITSCKADTTTETNDVSTVEYVIIRQT